MRGRNDPSPARPCLCYWPAVPLMVTCAQCRKVVLEADLIGDEEECVVRDHLQAVHPKTRQLETRSVLLRHFIVTEGPPGSVGREQVGISAASLSQGSASLDVSSMIEWWWMRR